MTSKKVTNSASFDPELADWLAGKCQDVARELIVEANVPKRQVRFSREREERPRPTGVKPHSDAQRTQVVDQLDAYLNALTGGPTTVLKAAGAVVVTATPEQTQQMLQQPFVRAIRPNRKIA